MPNSVASDEWICGVPLRLEQRIVRLEVMNWRLKIGVVGLLALFCTTFLVAAQQGASIKDLEVDQLRLKTGILRLTQDNLSIESDAKFLRVCQFSSEQRVAPKRTLRE
jgi:hypothetical protein